MVLAELGQRISQALGSLNSVTVVDEAVRCVLAVLLALQGPPACSCTCLHSCLLLPDGHRV